MDSKVTTKSETGMNASAANFFTRNLKNEGVIRSVLRHQSQLLHLKVESFAEEKHIIKDRRIFYAVERYDPETVKLVNTLIL